MIARRLGVLLVSAISACAHAPAAVVPWYPEANEAGDPVAGVFEGRVPCTEPGLVGCEKVKVALVLYRDGRSNTLTTYRLARVYVAADPEGIPLISSGAVSTGRGTKRDPNAALVRLDAAAPPEYRAYWVVDENVLFLLNEDLSPRVGTASWSYVLNRTR